MSGIAGHGAFSSSDLPINAFAAFARGLAHRGPDGFGTEYFSGGRQVARQAGSQSTRWSRAWRGAEH